jgi:Putative holin
MSRPRRERPALGVTNRSKVVTVIPLPRPWLLAGAMLVGSAVGLLAGVAFTAVLHGRMRPDLVIALVFGIPSVVGLLTILLSGRRWVTMAGAFLLALAPGWFGALVALRVASGG